MPTGTLSVIDYVIIAAYFAFVFGVGVWAARRITSGDDLFLAGRRLAWPVVGLSLFASNISSNTLVGVTADSYRYGLAVSAFDWGTSLVLVVLIFVLVPFYLGSKLRTVPQYLELRYGPGARRYQSAMSIVATLVVDTAGPLFAGALVLQLFFPDVPLWVMCVILAVVAGLYTMAGGLAAVVYTDAVQTVIIFVGTLIMALYVFSEFDFSWSNAVAQLEASPGFDDHLSVIRPADDENLPWPGLLTGVMLLGLYYWSMNQYIVQRVLGARSIQDAQWGGLLAGFLKLTPIFFMALPGVFALVLFPELGKENAEAVFPTLMQTYLPVGLLGLVLAGFIAAIMSSIDSTLNSASTLVVVDFVEPLKRGGLTDRQQAKVGRWTTLLFMVLAAAWAPMIANFGSFFQYLQQVFSYIVPPFIVLFMMGIFSHRGGPKTAVITVAVTQLFALGLFFAVVVFEAVRIQYLYISPILCAVALVVFFISAAIERAPGDEKLRGVTWYTRTKIDRSHLRWYANPRWQAALLVVLTLMIVVVFW
ncbi:MAG: sodium/solute symporter [Phycisphaerae bacterium]